jgi:hypothetical protein
MKSSFDIYKVGVVYGETDSSRKFLKVVGKSSQLVLYQMEKIKLLKNMNMVCKSQLEDSSLSIIYEEKNIFVKKFKIL